MAVPRVVRGHKGPIKLTEEQPRKGGQAEVHRGVDSEGRAVAVKIAFEGEDERRGLIAERDALSAIHGRQPGSERWLVGILDQGELPDGRPFLVLPWVEHSMASWLRASRPDLRRRLSALVLTAEAVVQLHRSAASLAGVVLHRDLKPGNLLIHEEGETLRVLLADLGGAKGRPLHGATRNTGIHTPWFAPLEQALPLERPPDPSVDVHALAVVFYTVIVGRPPQTVMSRTGLLTQDAEELVQLHQAGGGRSAEDRARYGALRRAPLERLIELDHAVALSDDDGNRLRAALAHQLGDLCGDRAEALAAELADILVPPLRHALDPNPRSRLSRPETLLGAISAVLERLPTPAPVAQVEEVATRAPPPAPPRTPSVPTPALPNASSRQRERAMPWRLVALLGLGVVLAAGCAGLVLAPTLLGGFRSAGTAGATLAGDDQAQVRQREPPPGQPAPSAPAVVETAKDVTPPTGTAHGKGTSTAPPGLDDGQGAGTSGHEEVLPVLDDDGGDAFRSAPARAEPPESVEPSTPPRLVISMAPSRGSSPYVWLDGARVTRGEAWQGLMEHPEVDVEIRESAEGPRRAFRLVREAVDASRWRITLVDASGPGGEKVVSVPEGGAPEKVVVHWCSDNTVRFGCPSSSDP